MAIKTLKNNTKLKLSDHINAYDFRCKCGKSHDIKIDMDLVNLLEKLFTKLDAKTITIYSAYRCPTHDKKVGGSGKGSHTEGKAVDCYFTDKNRKKIPSQKVCLALEDIGHKKGIGYRCGGGSNASGQTHIDVRNRKWYGDESKSKSKSCCSSFYKYFGIKKNSTATISLPKTGTYIIISDRNVYTSYSNKSIRKLVKDLTPNGKLHATSKKSTDKATLKKGTKVTVSKVVKNDEGHIWGYIPSGWICIISNDGTKHIK